MKKYGIFFFLIIASIFPDASGQSLDLDLFYDMDKYALSSTHQVLIDDLISKLDGPFQYEMVIEGYTDFVGTADYNVQLSENRASQISHYVLNNFGERIIRVSHHGFGELNSKETGSLSVGVKEHRKVHISLNRIAGDEVSDSTITGDFTNLKNDTFHRDFSRRDSSLRAEDRLIGIENLNSDSIRVGNVIVAKDLNFHAGRHILLKESIPRLKDLLKTLKNNPNLHIRIEGHICCGIVGEPDGFDQDTGEKKLSYNRAHNIYQYLVRNGIDKRRLSYAGFGYSRPIYYPERNLDEQRSNRRVEIIITKV